MFFRVFYWGNCTPEGLPVSYLHFRVREVLPVQNLVENMVWTLVNRQPVPAYQSGDDGAFAAAADALYGMH